MFDEMCVTASVSRMAQYRETEDVVTVSASQETPSASHQMRGIYRVLQRSNPELVSVASTKTQFQRPSFRDSNTSPLSVRGGRRQVTVPFTIFTTRKGVAASLSLAAISDLHRADVLEATLTYQDARKKPSRQSLRPSPTPRPNYGVASSCLHLPSPRQFVEDENQGYGTGETEYQYRDHRASQHTAIRMSMAH